jgi:hypothetical protein
MAAFFSQVAAKAKEQAVAMIPLVIETAKPQVKEQIELAMSKMDPVHLKVFSTNLNEINQTVQAKATAMKSQVPSAGKRKTKKRTRKVKHGKKH